MLTLTDGALAEMVAHSYRCYPEEACGLLAGDARSGRVSVVYPCRNAAESARVYTIEPRDHLLIRENLSNAPLAISRQPPAVCRLDRTAR